MQNNTHFCARAAYCFRLLRAITALPKVSNADFNAEGERPESTLIYARQILLNPQVKVRAPQKPSDNRFALESNILGALEGRLFAHFDLVPK